MCSTGNHSRNISCSSCNSALMGLQKRIAVMKILVTVRVVTVVVAVLVVIHLALLCFCFKWSVFFQVTKTSSGFALVYLSMLWEISSATMKVNRIFYQRSIPYENSYSKVCGKCEKWSLNFPLFLHIKDPKLFCDTDRETESKTRLFIPAISVQLQSNTTINYVITVVRSVFDMSKGLFDFSFTPLFCLWSCAHVFPTIAWGAWKCRGM